MGMYTELVLAVEFRSDTPAYVSDMLKIMIDGRGVPETILLPDHPLFKTDRWAYMLRCDSGCFPGESYVKLDESRRFTELTLRCSLKNYDSEIEWFLDFIKPYLQADGYLGYLGYMRYEEYDYPTLIYNDCGEIELVTIFDDDTIQRRNLSDCLNWYYK